MRESSNKVRDQIGRRAAAEIAMEVALGDRDLAFAGFEKPSDGVGVVAVAVNGERRLMHLGRDEADAMFRLAHLASLRP